MLITHIDQILPHLVGRREFAVVRKEHYTVIDYSFQTNDTFDEPVRTECRGIKFAPDGRILARPLHKFFNFGEKERLLPQNVDFRAPHVIMEKMDGSMIHPAIVQGRVALMTRFGITDHAALAQAVATPHQIETMRALLQDKGITPIFEFVAPYNRVIIEYAKPELVLLAMRETESGRYLSQRDIDEAAATLELRAVPVLGTTWEDAAGFMAWSRACTGVEGYVIRFEHGLWMKAKGEDYVVKHKAKHGLSQEKYVLALILANGVDDVLPLLEADDRRALETYVQQVHAGLLATANRVDALVSSGQNLDQKTFAVEHLKDQRQEIRALAFQVRKSGTGDGAALKAAQNLLGLKIGSQTEVDAIRGLFNATWTATAGLEGG